MFKRNFQSITLIALTLLLSAAFVSAQQGRFARTDVDTVIRNLENSSDIFSRDFKSARGTSTAERRNVDRFENAIDRLRSSFNSNNTWWNSRNDVQQVMDEARSVNVMMNSERFRRQLEQQWRNLRRDINRLANTYDLQDLEGQGGGVGNPGNGGWNPGGGGGWNGNGQTSAPPAWARGTFYATSGPNIAMMIEGNGRITLNNNGQIYYGRYYRNQMYLNNDVSTLRRNSTGFATYNRSTGATTFYSRDPYGGGGVGTGGGGYDNGPTSNPPNWAVGNFVASNGSGIQMSIANDGRVIVNNGGYTYTGRYYNGQIYLNNDVSTVSRNGRNGIRTYNQSSGVTTDYRR